MFTCNKHMWKCISEDQNNSRLQFYSEQKIKFKIIINKIKGWKGPL